ncbi:MAG: HAMP domain-containing histidine kinase [Butyrivibrio sp.]|nr:HAMP domain-containing histidine kinase [Muribaculum sp.]MCM1552780.1 HAMP domain-containing histidine kinase [Butyrivibrio sp.]
MIRQLRKQFILVAMCSMFAVLAVIVGSLNAAGFYGVVRRADLILDMLAANDGHFPKDFPNRSQLERIDGHNQFGERPDGDFAPELPAKRGVFEKQGMFYGLSLETPYDTRFFSVRMDENGGIVSIDTGRIAAVETEGAADYAERVWESGRSRGFLGVYRYLCQAVEGSSDYRVIFVDCARDLDSSRSLAATSVGVSLLGLLAVFVLVMFFSKRVFVPVEQSYRKQKQFVTDASHELKTPLTIISANVDILEMEGEESQWTASIRNQVKRLRALTEQMVTLSRLEEEERPMFASCQLSELAEETVAVFAPLAQAKGLKLTAEIAEGLTCMGDEDKLRQMLSLLLDNALKYASEQGEILLKLAPAKRGGKACITVWNTVGADSGIAQGDQSMLFERFFRPDASRSSQTGGSGIGLSVVKAIVEQHRGRITAGSDDGRSIHFIIFL